MSSEFYLKVHPVLIQASLSNEHNVCLHNSKLLQTLESKTFW